MAPRRWALDEQVVRFRDGTLRKLRRSSHEPGQAHEFTFSCLHRLPLLNADRTRGWLIEALGAARARYDFELWAYVIMPEHVHVLLLPRGDGAHVDRIVQGIKQPVAEAALRFLKAQHSRWLSRLCVRRQPAPRYRFWEAGGGYDRNIVSPDAAGASVDYIHNNPVRRGLVNHPCDWVWSSARWYAGEREVVLEMDGPPPSPRV